MAVAATGFFDGVHNGHALVIKELLSEARRLGEQSLVITFWPHPRTVLQQDARQLRILTSLEEKKALLLSMGVDRVEILPFSKDFAAMNCRQYLEMLCSEFSVNRLVLGYDTRFGSDRLGPESIIEEAAHAGIECVVAGRLCSGADAVSSTRIRQALGQGDVEAAAAMLGYRYQLRGVVVAGNQIGRTLGFPTANLKLYDPLKLVPGNGVYLTEVQVLGKKYKGMTNIGVRPTVSKGDSIVIETNIFDFDEMIYGLDLNLSFVRKIRDERRFNSLEELSSQLAQDRQACL